MKNIILIKQSRNIQLGHLYEHLFIYEVNRFFYEKGLFKSIDYALSGTVYDSGFITIDLNTYNDRTYSLLDKVRNLHIELSSDDKQVTRSLYQISAEEPRQLRITDSDQVHTGLIRLDKEAWTDIDAIASVSNRSTRRQTKPIFLTSEVSPAPRKAKIVITLNKELSSNNPDLLPLFILLGRLLLFTATNNTAGRFGLYSGDMYTSHLGEKVTSELLVAKLPPLVHLSVDDVEMVVQESIKYMLSANILSRIQADLANISYLDRSFEAPDYELFAKGANTLVGPDGWKEIATIKNMQYVIDSMQMQISLGMQKTSPKKIIE